MKKRHLIIISILFILSLLLGSCSNTKKVAYMQSLNANGSAMSEQNKPAGLYDAHFKPKDLLSITVVTSEPDASRNYNLLIPQMLESSNNLYSTPTMQAYLVDNEGNIDFPVLGKLKVAGLTRNELEENIQKKLENAFRNERPIITIRITNYSVNILGEVARPGKYLTANERMTLFEGLALAGDMTIYGKRDNVKIMRENVDGSKHIIVVNMNDKMIINSPAYFLEQGDVVYVEPNKSRSKSSNINSAETLTVSALSIIISLTSLIFNILR